MTIKDIYQLAIKMGIKTDPRSTQRINYLLAKEKKTYRALAPKNKEFFDRDKLFNPYGDTRYFNAQGSEKVINVLAGIDIGTGEVLLADRLSKSKKIDLIIAHHPLGKAWADLDSVMHLQTDLLALYGIPINIAESILEKRIAEVGRRVAAVNHYKAVDAARLLKFPLLCVHTPADNLVYNFVETLIKKNQPETVEELVELLRSVPEYKEATLRGAGPKMISGKPHRRCGRIAVSEMTGGTEGAIEICEKLSQAGIGTVVGMHLTEEHREEAEKHHLNVVVAGHLASDSIGMNLFLDQLEKKGVKIITTSGLIRIKR